MVKVQKIRERFITQNCDLEFLSQIYITWAHALTSWMQVIYKFHVTTSPSGLKWS